MPLLSRSSLLRVSSDESFSSSEVVEPQLDLSSRLMKHRTLVSRVSLDKINTFSPVKTKPLASSKVSLTELLQRKTKVFLPASRSQVSTASNSQQKGVLASEALRLYADVLTPFEREEMEKFKTIYTVGTRRVSGRYEILAPNGHYIV